MRSGFIHGEAQPREAEDENRIVLHGSHSRTLSTPRWRVSNFGWFGRSLGLVELL